MSKHEAEPSIKTELAERLFERVFGENTPDRNGKHRAVEAFNPATGTTTTFQQEPTA